MVRYTIEHIFDREITFIHFNDTKTGTHKDYWSEFIVQKFPNTQISLLSAGSAAISLQTKLKEHNFPSLRVLVDTQTDSFILDSLKTIGCNIFKTDLGERELTSKDILDLTHNSEGIDVTLLDGSPGYDVIVKEMNVEQYDYVLVPYGSGYLFTSLSKYNKTNIIGATVDREDSKAVKLYSAFRPLLESGSDVRDVQEHFLDEAIKLAEQLGIQAEPSGIAGLGLLLQLKDDIPRDAKILIVNTGKVKYP